MAYSDFTLEKTQKAFGLSIVETSELFADALELQPSEMLVQILEYNAPLALAINTEKSRSEMIITPVLIDLRKNLKNKISLFSGVDFSVDPSLGLVGVCDFLVTGNEQQLFIADPVVTIVEALQPGEEKNEAALNNTDDYCDPQITQQRLPHFSKPNLAKKENLNAGLGQCVSEMVAAQIFNERSGRTQITCGGAVTTGNIWKFLRLSGKRLDIDLSEYYLNDLARILGILAMFANPE